MDNKNIIIAVESICVLLLLIATVIFYSKFSSLQSDFKSLKSQFDKYTDIGNLKAILPLDADSEAIAVAETSEVVQKFKKDHINWKVTTEYIPKDMIQRKYPSVNYSRYDVDYVAEQLGPIQSGFLKVIINADSGKIISVE